jgi:hypothetical protein
MDSTNLDNNRAVKVSHDGKNVYALSWGSKALVSWDRDINTGVSAPLMNFFLVSCIGAPAAFFYMYETLIILHFCFSLVLLLHFSS